MFDIPANRVYYNSHRIHNTHIVCHKRASSPSDDEYDDGTRQNDDGDDGKHIHSNVGSNTVLATTSS